MIFVLPISRQLRCCVCRKNRHRQWRNGWFRWEYGDCGISVTVTSPWSRAQVVTMHLDDSLMTLSYKLHNL